jgi:LuxR family transcriptional regulator, quorum-sensing system regulator BjaR1
MRSSYSLEFIDELQSLTDPETIKAKILVELNKFGFSHFACTDLPQPGEALTDLWLIDEWNSEWSDRYLARNYVARDPMVHELFATSDPFRWKEVLKRREFDQADLRIVQEATEFGMNDGFVVPLHLNLGRSAVFTMAGPTSCLEDDRSRAALHLIGIYAHARLRKLKPLPPRRQIATLNPRERECLHWVAAGKSDWAISEILQISDRTVNKHIESAKARLGVATRMQAVVYAIISGQIHP